MPGPDSFVYMQREEAVSMMKVANVSVKLTDVKWFESELQRSFYRISRSSCWVSRVL